MDSPIPQTDKAAKRIEKLKKDNAELRGRVARSEKVISEQADEIAFLLKNFKKTRIYLWSIVIIIKDDRF